MASQRSRDWRNSDDPLDRHDFLVAGVDFTVCLADQARYILGPTFKKNGLGFVAEPRPSLHTSECCRQSQIYAR